MIEHLIKYSAPPPAFGDPDVMVATLRVLSPGAKTMHDGRAFHFGGRRAPGEGIDHFRGRLARGLLQYIGSDYGRPGR